MNLDQFKTVEQLAASIKTLISGTLNLTGLTVGSVGSAPASGEIQATGDIRTDGGVYVGNKAGSVANDNLITDGNATIGTYIHIGSPSAGLTGTGDLTTADDIRCEGDLLVLGTLYTENWQDYSSTSTVVGFSSFTTKEINYKKIGNLVWVRYILNGTSNSTSLSFTVPHTAQNMNYVDVARGWDNGGSAIAVNTRLNSGTSTVNCYNGMGSQTWTASGDKYIAGGIFYHTT